MSFCFFCALAKRPYLCQIWSIALSTSFPPILCQQLPACFSAVGIMELEEGFL